jgi:hypothetical protein
MNEPLLRQRSAVEIIDASFALYRANFAVMATTALVLLGPFVVIGALVGGIVGSLISSLYGLFAPIVVGAVVAIVSDAVHDRRSTFGSAFRQISGRWGTLVLVSFAQTVLIVLGLIVLVVPGILTFCLTFAAPMAVVVERIDRVGQALGRSRDLARGQLGHVFKTLALAWVILFVLFFVVSIGLGLVGGLVGLSDDTTSFLGQWAFILMLPFIAAASSVLYFDLRIRTEAYDVERLAETFEAGETADRV